MLTETTRVLNAKTTIDVTSTLVITSHEPVTQFITTTASPILPATSDPTGSTATPTSSATSTSVPSSSTIQTPAIVGIAVGGTVFAIIVAAFIIFFVRHRRRKDPFDNVDDLQADNSLGMRQPTYPTILPHFAPAASHHAAQFQPPSAVSFLDPSKAHTGGSPRPGHNRSSSGFTTLVGTPNTTVGGLAKKGDRLSAMTTMSGGTVVSAAVPGATVAEVPGSPLVERYEIDSSSPVQSAAAFHPPGSVSTPSQQQQQQRYRSGSYARDAQSLGRAYFQSQLDELDGGANAAAEMGGDEAPDSPQMQDQEQQQHQHRHRVVDHHNQEYYYPEQ